MRRLPPLTAVEAFLQVARLGSVKQAAEELALSPPALSRRIQAMERFVGRPLFDRRHQAMALNAEGTQLLAGIGPALDALAEVIDASRGEAEQLRLRLGVLPLWASQKLMPQLPGLRARHPGFHLDVDTSGHFLARLGEGLDAAIVLARDIDPALYSHRLGRDHVMAIGPREPPQGAGRLERPEDIARTTILIHRDMPDTFEAWRRGVGLPHLEPAAIDHFDSGQLMLEAAAQGLGIAFMQSGHLAEASDPRLVGLFDQQIESPYSYWFACRRTALSRRSVRLFRDWLVEVIAEEEGTADPSPPPADQASA